MSPGAKFLSHVLILYFPQTFVYFSPFSFAHLARLLATFCIFHILQSVGSLQIPALDLSQEPHLASAQLSPDTSNLTWS